MSDWKNPITVVIYYRRYLEEFLRACALREYLIYEPADEKPPERDWDSGVTRDSGTFTLTPQVQQH